MTLHEIEETLHDLQSRHDGLNESMLVTLLRSGGWEEKNIQEAILLFRSGGSAPTSSADKKKSDASVNKTALPSVQEDPVFIPQVDENHLLLEHNEDIPSGASMQSPRTDTSEAAPQSLIQQPVGETHPEKDELPHNLPLRPFETSEHIWPFSRYRAVFFGEGEKKEVEPSAPATQSTTEAIIPETEIKVPEKAPIVPVDVNVGAPKETLLPPIQNPVTLEKEIVPVPMTKGDEKLVITAAVMLVAILILLGYMYSNGRL